MAQSAPMVVGWGCASSSFPTEIPNQINFPNKPQGQHPITPHYSCLCVTRKPQPHPPVAHAAGMQGGSMPNGAVCANGGGPGRCQPLAALADMHNHIVL